MAEQDDAASVESLEHLDAREQAFHDLNIALQGYGEMMARLHDDPASLSEAQVDNAYADVEEAHGAWVEASGLNIKPL